MTNHSNDADSNKGAVEQDRPEQDTNTSMSAQLPHRNENPVVKQHDTDFPEPGETPEHSGEPGSDALLNRDAGCEKRAGSANPEGQKQEQDPGQRQKQNQGGKEDDPLAA
jgi:hypothetical protein